MVIGTDDFSARLGFGSAPVTEARLLLSALRTD